MRDRLLVRWGLGRTFWVVVTVAGFLGLLFWARSGMAAPARTFSPELVARTYQRPTEEAQVMQIELKPGENGARVVGRVIIDD